MSKLIYVDRLKKDILALRDCDNGFSDTYDKACIIGVIDEQPTIEERNRGEWLELTNTNHTYVCSVCGRMLVNISDGKNTVTKNYPFCHCGADMRGGNHETP